MTDTPPEVQKLYRSMLMARSGAERMRMGSAMFDAARAMVMASFPKSLTELEKKKLLLHRLYSQDFTPETLARIAERLR